MRETGHGRDVILELGGEQRHVFGLLPVGNIVGKQDDLNFRFGRNYPEVFPVPLGSDPNGPVVPVVCRFARLAFDVGVLKKPKRGYLRRSSH